MSQISDEDKSLFAAAIEGTQKIDTSHKISQPKSALKPRVKKGEQIQNQTDWDLASDHQSVSAHESLIFSRAGVRQQEIQKLKKGQFKFDWQLDLHGYTEAEAALQLDHFIQSALKEGIRSAIVIHGKGYNSDTDRPILKNLVNSRLRQINSVLAFCSAQQKDGGVGAVYILLKRG